ncbi:MAG: gamma-glutamyltransferase [Rhodospirillales bacterium]
MIDRIETWTVAKPVVRGRHGLVAAQSVRAAEAGAEILAAGGNAVDAAVATALALTACEPWMSGLGGIGSMIVHTAADGATHAVDFGPVAGSGVDPASYALTGEAGRADLFGWPGVVGDRNVLGPSSIVVPGSVAGFGAAHARFGRLPWRDLFGPAVRLAREGLRVDWWTLLCIVGDAADLRRDPAADAIYLRDGLPPVPASTTAMPRLPLGALPDTLERLAAAGWADFYRGDLAAALAADLADGGAPVRRDDLEAYAARIGAPLAIPRGDTVIHAMPGLYAGATLAAAIGALPARFAEPEPGPETFGAVARALAGAYADRLERMGAEEPGKGTTTHVAAVDADGNMVSLTNTLLSRFGARVVLPRTGILMNNGMMWFDPRPGRPNSIAPGRRPLTNMCPVIATRGGRGRFALGASGGRRILPAVMQVATFLTDFGMALEAAFHRPRIDVSAPDRATADHRLDPATLAAVAAAVPTTVVEPAVFPGNFANPIAVALTADGAEGMTNVTLPVAGVAGPVAGVA